MALPRMERPVSPQQFSPPIVQGQRKISEDRRDYRLETIGKIFYVAMAAFALYALCRRSFPYFVVLVLSMTYAYITKAFHTCIPAPNEMGVIEQLENCGSDDILNKHTLTRWDRLSHKDRTAMLGSPDYVIRVNIAGDEGDVIFTQLPIDKQTQGAFWEMIDKKNVALIVNLTNQADVDRYKKQPYKRNMQNYWPKTGSFLSINGLKVQGIGEGSKGRMFKLKNSQEVAMIRFNWEEGSESTRPHSLLLLELIVEIKEAKKDWPGPVVIHCCKGAGRSGTLITSLEFIGRIDEGQFFTQNDLDTYLERDDIHVQTVEQFTALNEAIVQYIQKYAESI